VSRATMDRCGSRDPLLVDGHNLVYRAFHAMPALSNSRGEMTNAAYGFTSMLFKALNDTTPTYAIAAFDPLRANLSAREIPRVQGATASRAGRVAQAVSVGARGRCSTRDSHRRDPDVRSRDVIGTLAQKAEAAGLDVIIVTGDLDVLQLVTEHIRVFASRRGISDTIIYDVDKVRERYGFEPRWSSISSAARRSERQHPRRPGHRREDRDVPGAASTGRSKTCSKPCQPCHRGACSVRWKVIWTRPG